MFLALPCLSLESDKLVLIQVSLWLPNLESVERFTLSTTTSWFRALFDYQRTHAEWPVSKVTNAELRARK